MKSQLLIDNDWVNAQDGATFERRHPVSNAMITEAFTMQKRRPIRRKQLTRRGDCLHPANAVDCC